MWYIWVKMVQLLSICAVLPNMFTKSPKFATSLDCFGDACTRMSGACCPAAACFRARSVHAMANPPPEASPETAKVGGKNPRLPATRVATHTNVMFGEVVITIWHEANHAASFSNLEAKYDNIRHLAFACFSISSHICTGLCLPDCQVPSFFFALTHCKISWVKEALSRNATQFCSLHQFVIRCYTIYSSEMQALFRQGQV